MMYSLLIINAIREFTILLWPSYVNKSSPITKFPVNILNKLRCFRGEKSLVNCTVMHLQELKNVNDFGK